MQEYTHDEGDVLLSTSQVAKILQASVPSVVRWRQTGVGPRYVKILHLVRYRKSDLDAFLDASARRTGVRHD